jgi:hypothetical protein
MIFASKSTYRLKYQGPDSQAFLGQIPKIFVTLGLNIFRFFRQKVFFEPNVIRD